MKRLIFHTLQVSWLMLGLFLYGLAIAFIVQARLGVSPWDVLHLGLTHYVPLSFGQVMIGAGLFCIAAAYPMGVKPRSGTLLNMIFIGVFADLILNMGWVPQFDSYPVRALFLGIGVITCGLATGIYITASMGTGPRDSLMMGLHKLTGWRVGLVRTVIEVMAVTLGFLLGGPVGLGTVVFSLSIGWTSEFFLNLFYRCSKQDWFINKVYSLKTDEAANQQAHSS